MAMTMAMRRLDAADSTDHGFRSAARSWMADNGVEFELAEACLAHAVGNAVVQAYQRQFDAGAPPTYHAGLGGFPRRGDPRQGRVHRLAPEEAMIRIAIHRSRLHVIAAPIMERWAQFLSAVRPATA